MMIDEKIIDKDLYEKYQQLVVSDNLLPIKISSFYMKKVAEEIAAIGIGGPLYRSVIPVKDKIELKTSVETRDYVEEDKHNPVSITFENVLNKIIYLRLSIYVCCMCFFLLLFK